MRVRCFKYNSNYITEAYSDWHLAVWIMRLIISIQNNILIGLFFRQMYRNTEYPIIMNTIYFRDLVLLCYNIRYHSLWTRTVHFGKCRKNIRVWYSFITLECIHHSDCKKKKKTIITWKLMIFFVLELFEEILKSRLNLNYSHEIDIFLLTTLLYYLSTISMYILLLKWIKV